MTEPKQLARRVEEECFNFGQAERYAVALAAIEARDKEAFALIEKRRNELNTLYQKTHYVEIDNIATELDLLLQVLKGELTYDKLPNYPTP